jgi:hypothetical protein
VKLSGFGVVAGAEIVAEAYGSQTCGGHNKAEHYRRVFGGIGASIKAILRVQPERCGEYEQNKGEYGSDSIQTEPPKH